MKRIYLANDWLVKRIDMTDQLTGDLLTGITPHCHLAATPNGAAIHASLEVLAMTELAAGTFIATIEGSALYDQLLAMWTTKQEAGEKLVVHERVLVDDGDYADTVPLLVERDRPAGVASA